MGWGDTVSAEMLAAHSLSAEMIAAQAGCSIHAMQTDTALPSDADCAGGVEHNQGASVFPSKQRGQGMQIP